MYPDTDSCPVEISRFKNLSAVVDVIFNPLCTNLVINAREMGVPSEGGLYMLVAQAVAASELFISHQYPAETVEEIYKDILLSKKNIVLTGMPSSGKSTVGRILAEKTGRTFYDLDSEIVSSSGMEITEIFEKYGEKHFRDLESESAKRISALSGVVISCGGGTVLRKENVDALKRNGVIFFIDRPLDQLVPTSDRPLALDGDAIKKRYDERIDTYISTCDFRVPVKGDAVSVAEEIGKEFFK